MKTCPKCQTTHSKPGIFCSRSCANSRVLTESHKAKTRAALLGRKKAPLSEAAKRKLSESARITAAKRRKDRPFETFCWDTQRTIVREEQQNICNRCGLSEWLGEKISLEVDHKNGDRKDRSRANLEALCPNCHSLTPTWRGRNIGRVIVSDCELLESLEKAPNIYQGLLNAGVAPHVRNYARARKLLRRT